MLRPFFRYYGGKWRAARLYPEPLHHTIIEPFAGSAGYSLRYPHKSVVLVDVNPVICGVWKYLIGASEKDILGLPDLLPEQSVDSLDVPAGAKYLIGFWLNGASSSPCKTMSKWARHATTQLFWGDRVRRRLAAQVGDIRHWTVIEASYTEIENTSATWFVDPPYHRNGKHYPFKNVDYSHLGSWCKRRAGQVIVCEEQGATWLPFQHLADIKATHRPGGTGKSKEVVWHQGCASDTAYNEWGGENG